MNVDLTKGQLLLLEWELPFIEKPTANPNLDYSHAYIEFSRGGEEISLYSPSLTPDEMRLEYHKDRWLLRVIPEDYTLLCGEPATFEMYCIGKDNETVIIHDTGKVTVHE